MQKKEKKDNGISMSCELVGIKNLKSTHNWRIEFDVYEIDNGKVKQLMDIIDKPVCLGIVESD